MRIRFDGCDWGLLAAAAAKLAQLADFMQRKNPGIFLTCFAKRPKIDDIPRDKLFIIIEWL